MSNRASENSSLKFIFEATLKNMMVNFSPPFNNHLKVNLPILLTMPR
jgi:hypothetical protein